MSSFSKDVVRENEKSKQFTTTAMCAHVYRVFFCFSIRSLLKWWYACFLVYGEASIFCNKKDTCRSYMFWLGVASGVNLPDIPLLIFRNIDYSIHTRFATVIV